MIQPFSKSPNSFPTAMFEGKFNQTETHIYNTRDRIGEGASCNVFKGVEKNSGQTRALKVFKDSMWDRSPEKQREVTALSSLRHRNIIGYFGKKKEIGSGRCVLVMEYCSGGSLQSYLQEPENIHGLRDPEFLIFLSDTCSGCKYLLTHGFVHRDIKPGNLLRHVQLDGSVVYKLADFGASKNVEEHGGEFMSLVGTEEYLHPEMYHQAFIRPGSRSVFTVGTDLWSLGVTTYHACAGEIPFKPHGGTRSNRASMYQMITQKPSGAIAGEQLTAQPDSVQWKYSLPHTCPLSQGLQKAVIEIISGLVEADSDRQWTFDTCEKSVHSLVSLRRVGVVIYDDSTFHGVYVPQKFSHHNLKETIAMATDVPADSQILIFRNKILEDSDVMPCFGSSVFDTEDGDDVIVVNKDELEHPITPWTPGDLPSFQNEAVVRKDEVTAIKLCSSLYLGLLQMHESVRVQRAQSQAQSCLTSHVESALYQAERKFKLLSETCEEKQRRLETLREIETTRCEITRISNQRVSSCTSSSKRILNKLHVQLWKLKSDLMSVREQLALLDSPDTGYTSGHKHSLRTVEGGFEESKAILKRIQDRKIKTPLSECEAILHQKDRRELTELSQSCVFTCRNELHKTHVSHQQRFLTSKRTCLKLLSNLHRVENVLDEVTKGRRELTHALTETSAFSGRAWKEVVTSISTLFNKSVYGHRRRGDSVDSLKRKMDASRDRLATILIELPEPEQFKIDL